MIIYFILIAMYVFFVTFAFRMKFVENNLSIILIVKFIYQHLMKKFQDSF